MLKKICVCCGLHQICVVAGNYAVIAYGACTGLTVWWITDREGNAPFPAYMIGCLYIVVFMASVVLVVSLSVQKKTGILLAWLLVMAMFLLPECGLNMWICIFILRANTVLGLGFLFFYVVRAVINVLCMICVQALYSAWKEERIRAKLRASQAYWYSPYDSMLPPTFNANYTVGKSPISNAAGRPPPLMVGSPGYNMPLIPPRKKSRKRMNSVRGHAPYLWGDMDLVLPSQTSGPVVLALPWYPPEPAAYYPSHLPAPQSLMFPRQKVAEPRTGPTSTLRPIVYDVASLASRNSVPPGALFDRDEETEPGFENFLLRKTLPEQIHSYKPKSLHDDHSDSGYHWND